jgi:hypothetical protein
MTGTAIHLPAHHNHTGDLSRADALTGPDPLARSLGVGR